MHDKNKILVEDDDRLEQDFERALKFLPHITILPKEWDVPEDDIYDEVYGDDDDSEFERSIF